MEENKQIEPIAHYASYSITMIRLPYITSEIYKNLERIKNKSKLLLYCQRFHYFFKLFIHDHMIQNLIHIMADEKILDMSRSHLQRVQYFVGKIWHMFYTASWRMH